MAELVEAAADGGEAARRTRQPARRRRRAASRVAVDAEHGEVVAALEQRLAVAAAAERGVDHDTGRDGREHVDDLVAHHGPWE